MSLEASVVAPATLESLFDRIHVAEARVKALEAVLRDIKNATGVTAKCSLANQAWINRRCSAAIDSQAAKGTQHD